MDPFTAFGVLAGVLQVVDSSSKALSKCQELYKDGSLADHRSTEEISRYLSDSTKKLNASLSQMPRPLAEDDTDIVDVSKKCSETAAELLAELEKLKLGSDSSLLQAFRKSARSLGRKSVIKDFQNRLERYQAILDTRILIGLKNVSVQQTGWSRSFDRDIQNLIVAVDRQRDTVAQLLVNQSQTIYNQLGQRLDSQEETGPLITSEENRTNSELNEMSGHQTIVKAKLSDRRIYPRSRSTCTCYCHFRCRVQSFEILKSILGSLRVSYVGGQVNKSCNLSSCRMNLRTTLNITYQSPRWLLTRILCGLLSFDFAGSPTIALQAPRIRPDTSEIFHLASAGDITAVRMMFDKGLASPNDVSYTFGYSILHFAVDHEQVEMIGFLLDQGANPELTNCLNLSAADLAWNRILCKRTNGAKRQDLSGLFAMTSLVDQLETRKLTRLQKIILGFSDGNIDEILLNCANSSLVNETDADGNTVLSWAARCANEGATRSLLRQNAEYDHASRFGSTALHYAASARSPNCIIPLLEAGADANIRNTCLHETPLHAAALRHDAPEEYMTPLLQYGADVHALDHEGSSVLGFAVQANHCRSAKYLLESGADIDKADNSGMTPLGLAVIYNHHAMLKLLLDFGADFTCVTAAKETLLHLCAQYGDLGTVCTIEHSSVCLPKNAQDTKGATASVYARLRGDAFASAFDKLLSLAS